MKFFWECEGEIYDFDPNKKYLIYYRGGFSPPHAGHFSLVDKYIHLPNVYYLIHQIGDVKRHGVPYWLNRKIWRIYIHELLPKDRILLEKCGSSTEVLRYVDHSDVEFDTVIYLRGNENFNIRSKIRDTKNRYRELIRRLLKRKIDIDFIFLDRPKLATLSATKLVELINRMKNENRLDMNKLRKFLPKKLSDKGVKYIGKNLMKYDVY